MGLVVAEVNHLRPYSRHAPSSNRATVSDRPTSEPPVDSVIHWPLVQKVAGSRLVRWGTARSMRGWLPELSKVRVAPSVMARGQV